MSTEAERRVQAAVRAALDELPIAQPSPASLRYRAAGTRPPRRTSWAAPVFAAAAVVTLVLVIGVVPGRLLPLSLAPPDAASMVLPLTVAPPDTDTAPSAAVAVYCYEDQLVLAGADGRSYRAVGPDPAKVPLGGFFSAREVRLSPDGTMLAGNGGVLLDLATGETRLYQLLPSDRNHLQGSVLAWSTDGGRVAYRMTESQLRNSVGEAVHGEGVVVLERRSGEVSYLAVGLRHPTVAFSPDGDTIAVSGFADGFRERELRLFTMAGDLTSSWPLPGAHRLPASGNGWSPDGQWLATQSIGESDPIRLTAVNGETGSVTLVAETGSVTSLLGWQSPTALAVAEGNDAGEVLISALPVDGGPSRQTSVFPAGTVLEPYGPQLASAGWSEPPAPSDSWRVVILAGVGVVLAAAVGYGWWSARRYGVRDRRQRAVE